ncbi:RNA-directed DNA polymerase, eukaryota, partial [Tanacetum coccineum]
LPRHKVGVSRWIKYIPIKVNIFAWRARQDCLPTRVNLIRRGITIESSLCPVCSVCEEDVCHIFFRCDLAQLVLRRICRWWGLDPHDWSSFQKWQSWILSIQFSSKVKAMLEGVPGPENYATMGESIKRCPCKQTTQYLLEDSSIVYWEGRVNESAYMGYGRIILIRGRHTGSSGDMSGEFLSLTNGGIWAEGSEFLRLGVLMGRVCSGGEGWGSVRGWWRLWEMGVGVLEIRASLCGELRSGNILVSVGYTILLGGEVWVWGRSVSAGLELAEWLEIGFTGTGVGGQVLEGTGTRWWRRVNYLSAVFEGFGISQPESRVGEVTVSRVGCGVI